MSLQGQAPGWMGKAVLDGSLSVLIDLRSVHRLKEEVIELEIFEVGRVSPVLRKYQLQLTSSIEHERRTRLRAHADPVQALNRRLGTVGLDSYLEALSMERADKVDV